MAEPGTPDWWLTRLYDRLHKRRPQIKVWDDWYSGNHPLPHGYEKAGPMLMRLYDTIGLNMLAVVTDAAHERMHVEGFKVGGTLNDDVWQIWQSNNLDAGSEQVFLEKMALSEAYLLVDPNQNRAGDPRVTPEHPDQCIVEHDAATGERVAGLKVWQDDVGEKPLLRAMVYLPDRVVAYAAPTRLGGYAIKPTWEMQETDSGANPLGEVSLVPFVNRPRMLRSPVPEFAPAISTQRRILKTLLDRMSMQDAGAFKAKWATGLEIPRDPETGEPVEDFVAAVDRMFINENPAGEYGQFQAEDIKQMLEAVAEDVKHAVIQVPTSPDQILGELVNMSADGLKVAQASQISRIRRHMRHDEEPLEDAARLMLKAGGKSLDGTQSMSTLWQNPEYRTDGELADAGIKALAGGVPEEAVWTRYFGATPDEAADWAVKSAQQRARQVAAEVKALNDAESRDEPVIGA